MQNTKELEQILGFLHQMSAVKNLLRYKGMPGWEHAHIERWDSVAEHQWRFALMAVMYHKYIADKPDLLKTVKMILVHDIVELLAVDYSPVATHKGAGGHAFSDKAYTTKFEREEAAAHEIFRSLPEEQRDECIALWREYAMTKLEPETSTPEGRYAYALDKLEAQIQIVDWNGGGTWTAERTEQSKKYAGEWSAYDPALSYVCNLLVEEMRRFEKK